MRGWKLRSQTASQVCQSRRNSATIVSQSRRIRVWKSRRSLMSRVCQSPGSRSWRFRQSCASRNRRTDQSRRSCAWDAVHWIRWPGCSSRTATHDGRRRSAASSSVLDERFKEEKVSPSGIKNVCSDSAVCYSEIHLNCVSPTSAVFESLHWKLRFFQLIKTSGSFCFSSRLIAYSWMVLNLACFAFFDSCFLF